jgi:hypothetical protein
MIAVSKLNDFTFEQYWATLPIDASLKDMHSDQTHPQRELIEQTKALYVSSTRNLFFSLIAYNMYRNDSESNPRKTNRQINESQVNCPCLINL